MRAIGLRHGLACVGVSASALLFSGCGTDASQTSSIDEDEQRVLLVVMGGNTSCRRDANGRQSPYGMDMYQPFQQLAADLQAQDRTVDFLLTCHNSDAVVHMIGSDAPDTMHSINRAAFQTKINDMKSGKEGTKVYLAGHSYGGWLAMKTAIELDIHYDGMFTLDPISRETCTFARPFGCTSAPGDITMAQRDLIASRSTLWANYFQTQTFYLHSSAIDQAHENVQLRVPHVGIETDSAVWERLTDAIMTDLM